MAGWVNIFMGYFNPHLRLHPGKERNREKKTDWPKEEKGHRTESSSDGRRGYPYLSGEQLPDFHMKSHWGRSFHWFWVRVRVIVGMKNFAALQLTPSLRCVCRPD